jgi:hypothetical protein
VEAFEFLGTDIVHDASEVFLQLTKLAFYSLFENLCVNNRVVQVDLLAALLKLFGNYFIVSAQADADLVISELLQSEAKIALKILDDFICALLRFVHHLKELVEFGLPRGRRRIGRLIALAIRFDWALSQLDVRVIFSLLNQTIAHVGPHV